MGSGIQHVSWPIGSVVNCARGGSSRGSDPPRALSGKPASVPLLDPQVARDVGNIAAHVADEALCVVAADEALDGIAERVVGAGVEVDDRRTRGMKPP